MTYQHQGLGSSSEALEKQSILQQDKNGQHIAHCVFKERGFEPWPKKFLKYILMERFIFLALRDGNEILTGTWDCPLTSCDEQFGTFPNLITHLEDCQHLKADTRQYTCPGCRAIVKMPAHTCPGCQTDSQMPAMSQGKKTILKIRDSFENLLVHCSPRARPSSAETSPVSPLSSHSDPFLEKDQAPFTSYVAANTNFNAQASNLFNQQTFNQHNRNVDVGPINTKLAPSPRYEMGSNESCMSSTNADSSSENRFYRVYSAPGASSATSLSQPTWSPAELSSIGPSCLDSPNASLWTSGPQPPCTVQYAGDLSFASTSTELPEHPFSHASINMEGMIPCFPDTSNLNITFSDVEKECQGELTSFYQFQWGQQEGSSSFMPCLLVDPAQQAYPGLEVTSSADPAHELYSPASTDVVMIDTPTTSEGSSPTTSDSPLLECEICHWRPDMGGKRPSNKLRLAVEKHVKRNHYSRDYRCRVCNQSFRNRPDNVKPHVRRKHPSKLAELYPETTAQQDGPQPCDKARALAKPAARRRASMPTPTSQASPARVKSVRRQSR